MGSLGVIFCASAGLFFTGSREHLIWVICIGIILLIISAMVSWLLCYLQDARKKEVVSCWIKEHQK